MKQQNASLIQSAVPASRGPLRHYEHNDEVTAFTRFSKGKAEEIHTPRDTLKRIHEVLHARHTDPKSYKGTKDVAWQLIEDCRLHLNHWPWEASDTPPNIKADTIVTIQDELALAQEFEGFPEFAHKLRAHAVYRGIDAKKELFPDFGVADAGFAQQLLRMVADGEHELAAKLVEKVFFDDAEKLAKKLEKSKHGKPIESEEELGELVTGEAPSGDEEGDEEGEGSGGDEGESADSDRMEIIELEKVEPTQSADAGFRVASSGARLYRPALRRPILSPRLFLKKSPHDPIGVICFDASSSMGVTQDVLSDCCKRAPTSVVGYYQGHDDYPCDGWLWVYARDGMRARETPMRYGGNGVDDLAIDWMLTFDGPRIMVTDRGFSCPNRYGQITRLANLKRMDEIEVCHSYDAFMKKFPVLA